MSSSFWKLTVRRLQHDACIICNEHVAVGGSWDHFVPAVYTTKTHQSLRPGLAFWAHAHCNTRRGHATPSTEMIDRAVAVIAAMPEGLREIAVRNMQTALRDHVAFVHLLSIMWGKCQLAADPADALRTGSRVPITTNERRPL